MKAAALREQTDEELAERLEQTTRELVGLKLRQGGGDSSEQPLLARTLRREAARIETVIRERELSSHG